MSPTGRARRERGSATVYGVGFLVVLVTVALAAATVAALMVGHRRAAAGADLAALAGAAAIQEGHDGCAQAARLAGRNRVRLTACTVRDEDLVVVVATEVASAFGAGWTVRARARAGPVG